MDGTNTVTKGPEKYEIVTVIPFAGAMGAEIEGVNLANLDEGGAKTLATEQQNQIP